NASYDRPEVTTTVNYESPARAAPGRAAAGPGPRRAAPRPPRRPRAGAIRS
ncbi:hypothetical protein KXX22_003628, partial [Aspergillus fumigatus]